MATGTSSVMYATHSQYSDPGRFSVLLDELPDDVESLCAASRNVIAHYRAALVELPEDRHREIDSRWLEIILAVDQARHRASLLEPRPITERVAGCCRDHSLFVVGALRQRGIPARTRVGFADYLVPGYHVDHVVVEHHNGQRWTRTDPELASGDRRFDVRDMPWGSNAPFVTAGEAWRAHRAGSIDADLYGVFPGSELAGPNFIATYVVFEVAHRFGDEMLLWDDWGRDHGELTSSDIDGLAAQLRLADDGDDATLLATYRADARLHPGATVTRHSPYGRPPVTENLAPRPA